MDIPQEWTPEWSRPRAARIKFRRGEGFAVQPEFEPSDGQVVNVHRPRIMEEGGHSLYVGDVCWDVIEGGAHLPVYLSEHDLEWVNQEARQPKP